MNARIQKNDHLHVRHVAKAFLSKDIYEAINTYTEERDNTNSINVTESFLIKIN